MRPWLFLLPCVLFAACAAPQTLPEWKKYVEESSFAKMEQFPIPGASLKAVEARLAEYSERCLSKELTMQRCGTFSCAQATAYATFIPKLVREGGIVRLTLQRREATKPLGGPQEFLIMVAEARAGSGVEGQVWAAKMGYGDLFGSAKGWLTGTAKTCPSF